MTVHDTYYSTTRLSF